MLSPDDLIASVRPRLAVHAILTDQVLLGRLEVLSRRLTDQRAAESGQGGLVSEIPAIQAELEAMAADIEAATNYLVFKALSGPEMETVKEAAPPVEQGYVLDPDKAGLPLLEAACVGLFADEGEAEKFVTDPPTELRRAFSADQAKALWDALPAGEQTALFEAAWGPQRRGGNPKSLSGTARTLSTALSSTGASDKPTNPAVGSTPPSGLTTTETSS